MDTIQISTETPLELVGLRISPDVGSSAARRALILTSQTFVIRAKNREALPSFALLRIQWNQLPVGLVRRATDITDEPNFSIDDDVDPPLVTYLTET